MSFPTKLLNDGERVVVSTRAHPKALVVPVLLVIVVLSPVTAMFSLDGTGATVAWSFWGVLGLVGLVLAARSFVEWLTTTYTFTNRCSHPQPRVVGNAVIPSATQKDRRVLTVAAVDCTGLNGKSDVIVQQWVDVLLVEPSLARTAPPSAYASGKEQIYIEIIGVAKLPNGNSAFQNYLRQRARLLR